jgi:hypothetical protein
MSINEVATITDRPLPVIGRCAACARGARLDEGVCAACLRPPRGRRWAELAARVRTDSAFAVAVYLAIESPAGRCLFVVMFGFPADRARDSGPASKVLDPDR